MLLPDITTLLYDPDVGGGQPFTIKRTTISYRKGRYEESAPEYIQAAGSVQPSGVNPLSQQPEADRDDAVYIVRTRTALQMGSQNADGTTVLSDEIIYNGEHYKILSVKEWQARGMYVTFMTRIEPSKAQEEEADEDDDSSD